MTQSFSISLDQKIQFEKVLVCLWLFGLFGITLDLQEDLLAGSLCGFRCQILSQDIMTQIIEKENSNKWEGIQISKNSRFSTADSTYNSNFIQAFACPFQHF
ncbi:unnamed protein product [Moneuplotes crassus]|uniref:Uncharacterized protein n=1 Tax=Euplotes crassus TaxID=5936 RepID=A0AAD1XWN1_EUPCR|nr:unnamed protein product [Moneuplotes crassus]